MNLFGGASKHYVDAFAEALKDRIDIMQSNLLAAISKRQDIFERRLDAADSDRRRLKGNLDKLGAQVTDLECKLKSLTEGKCNAKKHK